MEIVAWNRYVNRKCFLTIVFICIFSEIISSETDCNWAWISDKSKYLLTFLKWVTYYLIVYLKCFRITNNILSKPQSNNELHCGWAIIWSSDVWVCNFQLRVRLNRIEFLFGGKMWTSSEFINKSSSMNLIVYHSSRWVNKMEKVLFTW